MKAGGHIYWRYRCVSSGTTPFALRIVAMFTGILTVAAMYPLGTTVISL